MNILQKRIQEASQKYYSGEESGVSDEEFDSMLNQLREEDPDSELLTAVGHGYNLDLDTTPGSKVKHWYGDIGSIDKCHNWCELGNTKMMTKTMWASLKLDGLSVVLYYRNRQLVQALTRGKNNIGIDITEKVKHILSNYEKELASWPEGVQELAIRGEIIMSYKNFDKFKKTHPDATNPRNSAAGLINGKEITDDYIYLSIVVYTVVGITGNASNFSTYQEMHKFLSRNFFNTVTTTVVDIDEANLDAAMSWCKQSWYGTYPADGIVLTYNELPRNNLGGDKHEITYDCKAYKFPTEAKQTTVRKVEWNLSKTKYLIPRIEFDAVELAGTTVTACAGHNAQYISENAIAPGAVIEVTKANEIIPYLTKIVECADGECFVPELCPHCGADLEWNGVHLMCPNRDCGDGAIQDVLVWLESISPYDNLGDKLKLKFLYDMFGDNISIERIYQHGPINYQETATVRYNDFQNMYNRLFEGNIKLSAALKALNIPRFGDITCDKFAQMPDLVQSLLTAVVYQLPLPDYSDRIGSANWISLSENLQKFKRLALIENRIIWQPEQVADKGKVAITGKLSVKRSQFEEELKAAGYQPTGTINKETKFLITDDPTTSTTKNIQADKFGVTKITEAEFRKEYI